MSHELSLEQIKKEWHGSYKSYVIGFLISLILTSISFSLVIFTPFSERAIIYTLLGLAIIQAFVQLIFFLHLGQEDHPKWETIIFAFVFVILLAVVIGTLWIMHDLGVRMMPMEMSL